MNDDFHRFIKLTGRFPSEIQGLQPKGIHWLWWVNPALYEFQFGKSLPELPKEWRRNEFRKKNIDG